MKNSIMLALAIWPTMFVAADAQSVEPVTHVYRGGFVCEKQPAASDILHVPADLVVRGDQVQFGRPLFNLQGNRVVGSELASGQIDSQGVIKLGSIWSVRGIAVHGAYEGKLTSEGGTLTGKQTWRGPDGAPHSRTCHIALVPLGT